VSTVVDLRKGSVSQTFT